MKVEVRVELKPGVLDPQGKAVAQALGRLGYNEVQGARVGKIITLEIEDGVAGDALTSRIQEMCDAVLANPVIESYTILQN